MLYKVVQIWPGLFVCKQVTVCPGHIWTTLYLQVMYNYLLLFNLLSTTVLTDEYMYSLNDL